MKTILLSSVSVAVLLATISPGSQAQWIQSTKLQNLSFTGFGTSGNSLIAGVPQWGGPSADCVFISTDEGASWTAVDTIPVNDHRPGLPVELITRVEIFANGSNIFVGIGDAITGSVYLSSDGGISWTEPDTGFVGNINTFAMVGGTFFAGTDHGVFLSTNNGTGWSPANAGMTYQVVGLAAIGTSLFAGTPSAGVFVSTDNGGSWREVNTGLTNIHIYGLAAIGSTLFAGAFQSPGDSSGGVFVSTDDGANWNVADTGLTAHTINALTASGRTLYAGTNSGVFASSDNGARWIDISSDTPVGSSAILALAVSDSFLLAGTNGNGVWRYPLSQLSTGVKRGQGQVPYDFALTQNYPNPFNPSTTIAYALPNRSRVTLTIFNTLGQQVATLVNESQDAGYHDVRFDGSGLASGVYFYRMQAGDFVQTRKLVLLR